jgi:hypothetical protein
MKKYRISILIFSLAVLFGVLNMINGRFQMRDLQVYYDAAMWLFDGESPYGRAFGLSSGYYKYSSSAALLFTPLHLLGWFSARVFFFLLISVSFASRIPQLIDWIQEQLQTKVNRNAVALLVVLSLVGHFSRELLLGNVNWLLLIWVFSGFILLKSKPVLSGALFALALIFKPHFIIIVPWLILRREWTSVKSMGAGILILLFLPAIGWGWGDNLQFLKEWLHAMQAHNASLAESANTIYGIPAKLTGIDGSRWIVLFLAVVSFLILFWMLRHFKQERTDLRLMPKNRLIEFSALLAIIPNLVHTDTEHFMWTFPMLVVLAIYWLQTKGTEKWVIGLLWMLALIPFAFSTPDIWGSEGARWLEQSGVLGIANIVLIVITIRVAGKYQAPD